MTVVEKGSVHWATTQDQELRQIEPIATNGNAAALLPVAGNALLSFYMSMMNVLTRYRPPEFDLVGYVNAAGGLGPHTVTVQHL